MSWQAYADESVRGRAYMMCLTMVSSSKVKDVRRNLRALASPRQRRVHFVKESDSHRRRILREMAGLDTTSVIYVVEHQHQLAAREAILRSIVNDVVKDRVSRLVLESRAGQDRRDRSIIARAIGSGLGTPLDYAHHVAHDEPLLWIPDALAWSWGRGGHWRKSVDELGLVVKVEEIEVL